MYCKFGLSRVAAIFPDQLGGVASNIDWKPRPFSWRWFSPAFSPALDSKVRVSRTGAVAVNKFCMFELLIFAVYITYLWIICCSNIVYIYIYQCSSVVCPSTVLNWLILLMQAGLLKYSIQVPQVETSGFRGSARVHALKQWSVSFGVNFVENWITIGLWMDIEGYCRYRWHSFFHFESAWGGYCCQKVKSDGCLFVFSPSKITMLDFLFSCLVGVETQCPYFQRQKMVEMVWDGDGMVMNRLAERHQVSTVSCILLSICDRCIKPPVSIMKTI